MQTENGPDMLSGGNATLQRNDLGIIDFQASKSFHNNLLSPPNLSDQMQALTKTKRKAMHLPSDHPDMQGIQEVPFINEKSAKIAKKRFEKEGKAQAPVHQRLFNQTLIKDELASKMAQEKLAENTRKQEFILRNFSAHRQAAHRSTPAGRRMYTKGIKSRENKIRMAT